MFSKSDFPEMFKIRGRRINKTENCVSLCFMPLRVYDPFNNLIRPLLCVCVYVCIFVRVGLGMG